jgi:hypothetical protein
MALRLGRFFGNGTELWMGMQTRFDLWGIENDPEALREARRIEPGLARSRRGARSAPGRDHKQLRALRGERGMPPPG